MYKAKLLPDGNYNKSNHEDGLYLLGSYYRGESVLSPPHMWTYLKRVAYSGSDLRKFGQVCPLSVLLFEVSMLKNY